MTNPYGGLKPHPLAESFPMIEGDAYERFRDLVKPGVRTPIVMFEGMILDGRNRKKASQELGLACPERTYDPDTEGDPAAFVWSENADGRRHMDKTELAIAAEKLATARQGAPKGNDNSALDPKQRRTGAPLKKISSPDKTLEDIAKTTGVPKRAMQQVRRVTTASPEAIEAVQEKKITLKAAERVAKAPEEERPAVLKEEIKKAAAPRKRAPKSRAVPQVPPPKPDADPLELIKTLQSATGALINIDLATDVPFFRNEITSGRLDQWTKELQELAAAASELSQKIGKAKK